VVVHCVPAPSAIEMNGNSLSASEIGPAPSWHWDRTTRALTIELANCDVSEPIALKISC
jgi:hypothetical protein